MRRPVCMIGLLTGLAAAQLSGPASDGFAENHRRGESHIRRGELREAIPYLRRAYQSNPSDYNNAFDLAQACLQTSNLACATQVIQDLLKRKDISELHNLLGDVEEASGRTEAAVREYELAARMDPSEKNIFDLGSELQSHAGFEQAAKVFEYGAGKHPQSARMRVGLGVAYYSLSRYKEAVESFCAAVDLDPRDTRALDFIGKVHSVAPELDEEVTQRLARFVKLHPQNASANYYYALSLRNRSGAPDSRIEPLLRKAIELDPKLADAHYQLGLLYEDRGEAKSAIKEYEMAVKIRPDLKAAHYRLARMYAADGNNEAAERERQLFRSLQDR